MESQANIRVLKAVVIVLGLLILVSIGIIAVTIYRRLADSNAPPPAPVITAPPATDAPVDNAPSAGLKTFGDHKVDLPGGARLIETRIAGDRMFLRVRLLGGSEVWMVLSLLTGDTLCRLDLVVDSQPAVRSSAGCSCPRPIAPDWNPGPRTPGPMRPAA
jgi:hypothetical protein